jgi:glucosylceramidase
MKVQQSLLGLSNANTLLSEEAVYQSYAQYFVRVLDAYESQGLHIDFLTLQNEPLFGTSDQYPGMYLSATQELHLAKLLVPLLADRKVQLLGYDHNWDHPEYPQELLAERDQSPFAGTAWHCYGGDMASAHDKIHELFPEKEQHVTECTGGYPDGVCDISKGMTGFGYNHEWDMQNIFLGATGHWSSSGLKWILALDEHCGPTLPLVTFTSGRAVVAIPSTAEQQQDILFNQDFWTIAHMSKFVSRDSYHVTSTLSGIAAKGLLSESFVNRKTSLLTTIVMNVNREVTVDLQIKERLQVINDSIPPFSTKVYQWKI